MTFLDEQIIAERAKARQMQEYTIDNQIFVDEVAYTFGRRMLFEECASMVFPESFAPMPPEAARLKFPSENRPQLIFCNEAGSITFGFTLLDMSADKSSAEEIAGQMKGAMKRVNPALLFQKQETIVLNEHMRVTFFTFTSYAVDMDLRNLVFVVNIADRPLLGSFCCPEESGDAWRPLLDQMLRTLTDETQTTGKGGVL